MLKGAGVILVLENDNVVLQRRDNNAHSSPNKLGIFGGHIEGNESSLSGVKRELAEETSLDVSKLTFDYLLSMDIPSNKDNPKAMHVDVFKSYIETDKFEVFEGAGAETYSLKELIQRDDLDYYVKFIIDKLKETEYGFIDN